MRILYVFPHPDDESFGPARAISAQRRAGHEVFLLTLTRGGATRVRFDLGLSVEEMGAVRAAEMEDVKRILDLSGMTIEDLPDSDLKDLDPRRIEAVVEKHVREIAPQILVTYAVHGVSGFHDHLVCHAAVKRVYCALGDEPACPVRRLAFFTLAESQLPKSGVHPLKASTGDEIDVIVDVDEVDIEANRCALDAYVTYAPMIARTGIKDMLDRKVAFELFQESFDPPLSDLATF